MTAKKFVLAIVLAAVSCLSFVYAGVTMKRAREIERGTPNILIISLCSFQRKLLSDYGGAKQLPNLEKFFRESQFVFTNALNGLGWTALFGYTKLLMPPAFFFERGYDLIGNHEDFHIQRIPPKKSWDPQFQNAAINDNDYEKDHAAAIENLKKLLTTPSPKPFFVIAHFKYLHYPLIDRYHGDESWNAFLSDDEKALVREYVEHGDKHTDKLPFLLMLTDDPKPALAHPRVKKQKIGKDPASLLKLTGLITNPEFLAEWQNSPGYAKDLEILEKIYRANAQFLDRSLGPVLDLWNDRELQRRTIVMISGDHGEVHMERGQLTHGLSLYDEALRVPFAARFPQGGRREVITDQVHYDAMAEALKKMIESGESTPESFRKGLQAAHSDVMLGRDCMNTVRGLRYKNKYKYFVRLADGERFLFDLENDPGELHNLSPEKPEVAAQMEALYWENFDRFKVYDPFLCSPWTGTANH